METSSSRSSFLIVFLLLLTPPSPFPPSRQGKVRPSGVCSPISCPPSLNTIWESTLLMEFPDVHVILVLVSFWICSSSSDVLCLSPGIGHASKLHTLQQEAPESQLEESLMQAGVAEPSLLVLTPAELSCSHRHAEGVQHPISTQPLFNAGQLSVHTPQLSLLACALPGRVSQQTEINQHVKYQEE